MSQGGQAERARDLGGKGGRVDLVAGSELGDEGSRTGEGGGEEGSMGNCMCQTDRGTGCSDIWPNIFLGVSIQVFLDETKSNL